MFISLTAVHERMDIPDRFTEVILNCSAALKSVGDSLELGFFSASHFGKFQTGVTTTPL